MFEGIDWATLRPTSVKNPQAPIQTCRRLSVVSAAMRVCGHLLRCSPVAVTRSSGMQVLRINNKQRLPQSKQPLQLRNAVQLCRPHVSGADRAWRPPLLQEVQSKAPQLRAMAYFLHFQSAHSRAQWEDNASQDGGPSLINCCNDCEATLRRGKSPQYALASDLWAGPAPHELQDLTEVTATEQTTARNIACVTFMHGFEIRD